MCGRVFCALDPSIIQCKCVYQKLDGSQATPLWMESNSGGTYKPSYNIAPTSFTPVLVSGEHHGMMADDRVLQVMRWGLIPAWHKGDRHSFKTMHNNCRSETLFEKSTFSTPLNKGRRCAVIAEGFYEWKTTGKMKQPNAFTIKEEEADIKPSVPVQSHGVQSDGVQSEGIQSDGVKSDGVQSDDVQSHGVPDSIKSDSVCSNRPLMFMAGIFDIHVEKGEPLYSYCILTIGSCHPVADVHDRMPVILQTPEELDQWLNFQCFPPNKIGHLIQSKSCLQYHRVSGKVNNVRNKDPDCLVEVQDNESNKQANSKMDLRNWFAPKQPKRERETSPSDTKCKKLKGEVGTVKEETLVESRLSY